MKIRLIILIIVVISVGLGVTKLSRSDKPYNDLNKTYNICIENNKELSNQISNFKCVPKEVKVIEYINITQPFKMECNTTNKDINWTVTKQLKARVDYLEKLTADCFVLNETERNLNLTIELAKCEVEIDKIKDYVEDIQK